MLMCLQTEFKTVTIENWSGQGIGLSQKNKLGRGKFDLGHWPRDRRGTNGDRRGTEIRVIFFVG